LAVTRLFSSYQQARQAIHDLEAAGVEPHSISVVTRLPEDAETLEHDTGASERLEDASLHRGRLQQFVDWLGRVESVAVPGFGAVLGTGDIWQDVRVAGSGNGSITGALVGAGVPVDTAASLERSVWEGQILVVVHGDYDEDVVSTTLNPTTQV
jgi:Heat induced stress protein YflT